MTEREELAKAVRTIAWGYLLIYLNFNLGTLDVLPDWLGFCLMVGTLPVLAKSEESAGLLKPFGMLLAIWNGVLWIVALFGETWDGGWLSIVAAVVSLYFNFQLLTNLASLSETFGCPETDRILRLRTVQTVLNTVLALPVPWERFEAAAVILVLVAVVVAIWICVVLFSLRRSLEDSPGAA